MRRAFAVLALACPLMLAGACVYTADNRESPPMPVIAPPMPASAAPVHARITATLPDTASEGLPPAALEGLAEGVPVLLDLTLNAPLEPAFIQQNGAYVPAESCDFGPVPASGISIPTGSNHMLLDVELGSRDTQPANLLSCEYDPAQPGQSESPVVWRLRGCFLPYAVSIPTATVWALNPLPANACGIGD